MTFEEILILSGAIFLAIVFVAILAVYREEFKTLFIKLNLVDNAPDLLFNIYRFRDDIVAFVSAFEDGKLSEEEIRDLTSRAIRIANLIDSKEILKI